MRLQQFVPPLDETLVEALSSIGIKTDTDLLLLHDPLTIFTKLPPDHNISLREFRDMLAQVTALAASTPTCGDRLYELESKRQEDVFADDMLVGVPDVDRLLGGFGPPRVVEISGDPGSGKTVGLCCCTRQNENGVAHDDFTRHSPCRSLCGTCRTLETRVCCGLTAAGSSLPNACRSCSNSSEAR